MKVKDLYLTLQIMMENDQENMEVCIRLVRKEVLNIVYETETGEVVKPVYIDPTDSGAEYDNCLVLDILN